MDKEGDNNGVIDYRRTELVPEGGKYVAKPYNITRAQTVKALKKFDPITSGFLVTNWKRSRRGWATVPKLLGIEHLADFSPIPDYFGVVDEFQEYRTKADEIDVPENFDISLYNMCYAITDLIAGEKIKYNKNNKSPAFKALLEKSGVTEREFDRFYEVSQLNEALKEKKKKNRNFKPSENEQVVLDEWQTVEKINDKREALYGRYGARFPTSWRLINDIDKTFNEALDQCRDEEDRQKGNKVKLAEIEAKRQEIIADQLRLHYLANQLICTKKKGAHRVGSGIFNPANHKELQKFVGTCLDKWTSYQVYNTKKLPEQLLDEVDDSEVGLDKRFKDVLKEIARVIAQDKAGKKIESSVLFKEMLCDPTAVVFTCGSAYGVKSGDRMYCVGGGKDDWGQMVEYILKYIQDRDEWSTRLKISGSPEFVVFAKSMLRKYSFRWGEDEYGEGYGEVFQSYGDQIQNVQNKSTSAFEQGFWVETVAVYEEVIEDGKLVPRQKMIRNNAGIEEPMTMSIVAWDPQVVHTFGKDMPWTHFRNFACERPPDYSSGVVRKNWNDANKEIRQGVIMRFNRDGSVDESYLSQARLRPMTQKEIKKTLKQMKGAAARPNAEILKAAKQVLAQVCENQTAGEEFYHAFEQYLSGAAVTPDDVMLKLHLTGMAENAIAHFEKLVDEGEPEIAKSPPSTNFTGKAYYDTPKQAGAARPDEGAQGPTYIPILNRDIPRQPAPPM